MPKQYLKAERRLSCTEFHALKHESSILGHSSNPASGFSEMKQVRLCAVWPMENWLGSSLNQIQGWTTVPESYSRALEQGHLILQQQRILRQFCRPSLSAEHRWLTIIMCYKERININVYIIKSLRSPLAYFQEAILKWWRESGNRFDCFMHRNQMDT